MSVKKFGVDGKRRFTVKFPYGTTCRYGTCNPAEDERFGIVESEILGVTKYFLVQYQQHDYDYSQPEKQRALLPEGTLVANGYYNEEHDDFVTPEVWLKQT